MSMEFLQGLHNMDDMAVKLHINCRGTLCSETT